MSPADPGTLVAGYQLEQKPGGVLTPVGVVQDCILIIVLIAVSACR